MKRLSIAMFVCLCAATAVCAQEALPFPAVSPEIQKAPVQFAPLNPSPDESLREFTIDETAIKESAEYRYQHTQQRAETPREAVIRVAKQKGELRRYRLEMQKAMGVSNLRPMVSPYQALGTYSELWYGGQTVPGYAYPRAYYGYGYQYQSGYSYPR